MKQLRKLYPIVTVAIGLCCAFFRTVLFHSLDDRGLYDPHSLENTMLAIFFCLGMLGLWLCSLGRFPMDHRITTDYPLPAIGTMFGAAAHLFWSVYGFSDGLALTLLRLGTAACFALLAVCRFNRRKPSAMLLCVLSGLMMVLCFTQYQSWRRCTQLQEYLLPGAAALLLALYSFACVQMETPEKKSRAAFACGQMALLASLSCLGTQMWPYYLGMSLWLIGGVFDVPYKMQLPAAVLECMDKLEVAGFTVYAVGGCVRDSLLGLPPHDFDLCTNAQPAEINRVFQGYPLVQSGQKHGTVGVVYGKQVYEITTYRTEGGYGDNRHPGWVQFVDRLEQDLARRDFTVNAIAYHPRTGYIDPYGGMEDLKQGVLRAVGTPEARFEEDALRILRGVRFACRFRLTPERKTLSAMERLVGLTDHLARERVYSELTQTLCYMTAGDMLFYQNILTHVIPELRPCLDHPQYNPHHRYDIYTHTAHVLENTEKDPAVRWAALLHDTGKPETFTRDAHGCGHFRGHAKASAAIADSVLQRMKAPNALREEVVCLVAHHMDILRPDKNLLRKALSRYGYDTLKKMILFQGADRKGTGKQDDTALTEKLLSMLEALKKQEGRLQIKDLAITGHDLIAIGYKPDPQLGACQKKLLEMVLCGQLPNEKQALLNAAGQMLK